VRPARHCTDFAHLHTDAREKGPDLGWAASNVSQVFNCGLRFGHGAWWMGAEVCLECGLMLIERTGLSGKMESLQSFDTVLLIQMQDRHDGLTGNAAQARNLLVRHAVTFEVDDFHTLLYVRRGMSIAFIFQGGNLRLRKSDLNHDVLLSRIGFTTNTSIVNQW
jgi:hypothetical protein